MAQIPEWVIELAEISDYEYHFNRLKKFMNEDRCTTFS